jgi:hypothetical protein
MTITYEQANYAYVYEPENGRITYRVTRSGPAIAGRLATHSRKDGYQGISFQRKHYLAHRIAWLLTFGQMPTIGIDHINGNPADNRLCNLRLATDAQNNQNRRRGFKSSTSPLIGASFHRRSGAWVAQIRVGAKNKWLGYHPTEQAAHEAYVAAKRVYHAFGTI